MNDTACPKELNYFRTSNIEKKIRLFCKGEWIVMKVKNTEDKKWRVGKEYRLHLNNCRSYFHVIMLLPLL